jgi:hypothetical protein
MTSDEHDEHLKRTDRVLTTAYRFANGNVMAFDQFGQQMPEYQGRDAATCIYRDYPNMTIQFGVW